MFDCICSFVSSVCQAGGGARVGSSRHGRVRPRHYGRTPGTATRGFYLFFVIQRYNIIIILITIITIILVL